ncbi:hypothetical protein JCM10213v2_006038 [Rhodosporidiobolus nylandii]
MRAAWRTARRSLQLCGVTPPRGHLAPSRALRIPAFLPSFLSRFVKPGPAALPPPPARLTDEAFARLPTLEQVRLCTKLPVPTEAPKLRDPRVSALLFGGLELYKLPEAEARVLRSAWHPERLESVGDKLWHYTISQVLFLVAPIQQLVPTAAPSVAVDSLISALSTNDLATRLSDEFQLYPVAGIFKSQKRHADIWEANLAALDKVNGRRALLEFLVPIICREYYALAKYRYDALPPLRYDLQPVQAVIPSPLPPAPAAAADSLSALSLPDSKSTPTAPPMSPTILPSTSSAESTGPVWSFPSIKAARREFEGELEKAGLRPGLTFRLNALVPADQGRVGVIATAKDEAWRQLAEAAAKKGKAIVVDPKLKKETTTDFPIRVREFDALRMGSELERLLRSSRKARASRLIWGVKLSLPGHASLSIEGNGSTYSACWNKLVERCVERGIIKLDTSSPPKPAAIPAQTSPLPSTPTEADDSAIASSAVAPSSSEPSAAHESLATPSPEHVELIEELYSEKKADVYDIAASSPSNAPVPPSPTPQAPSSAPASAQALRFPDLLTAARDLRAALEQGGYEFTLRLEGRRNGRTHILNVKGWEQVSANQVGTRQGVKSRYPLVKACIEHGYIVIGGSSPAQDEAAVASTPSSPPAPPDYSMDVRGFRKAPPPRAPSPPPSEDSMKLTALSPSAPLTFATEEEAVRSLLGTLSDKDIPFLAVWDASAQTCYLRLPGYVAWTGTLLGKSHDKPAEVSFARAVRGAITSGAIVIGENSTKTAAGDNATSPPLIPSSALSSGSADSGDDDRTSAPSSSPSAAPRPLADAAPEPPTSPAQLASYLDLIEDFHAEVAGAEDDSAAPPTTQTSDSPLPPLRNYKHFGQAVLDFGKVLSSTHPRATLYRFWLNVPGHPVAYGRGSDRMRAFKRMVGSAKNAGSFVDCDVDPSSDPLALEQHIVELCKAGLGSLGYTVTLCIPSRRMITVKADRSCHGALDVWQLLVYTAARQGIISFESISGRPPRVLPGLSVSVGAIYRSATPSTSSVAPSSSASTSSPVPDTPQFDSTTADAPLDTCASSLAPKDEPAPRAMDLPNPASSLSPVLDPLVAAPDMNALLAAAGLPTSPESSPPSVTATPSAASRVQDKIAVLFGADERSEHAVEVKPKQDRLAALLQQAEEKDSKARQEEADERSPSATPPTTSDEKVDDLSTPPIASSSAPTSASSSSTSGPIDKPLDPAAEEIALALQAARAAAQSPRSFAKLEADAAKHGMSLRTSGGNVLDRRRLVTRLVMLRTAQKEAQKEAKEAAREATGEGEGEDAVAGEAEGKEEKKVAE